MKDTAKKYDTASSRWAAVVSRSSDASSAFVVCKKMTKVYCRPSCNVRLARRANIEFRDCASDAERAHYRPCRRCRPELQAYNPQNDIINRACESIMESKDGIIPSLAVLAKGVGLTKSHFHRLFKRTLGCTPKEFGKMLQGNGSPPNTRIPTLGRHSKEGSAPPDVSSGPVDASMSCWQVEYRGCDVFEPPPESETFSMPSKKTIQYSLSEGLC